MILLDDFNIRSDVRRVGTLIERQLFLVVVHYLDIHRSDMSDCGIAGMKPASQ